MKDGKIAKKYAFSQIRTDDLLITSEVPYHLAIKACAQKIVLGYSGQTKIKPKWRLILLETV